MPEFTKGQVFTFLTARLFALFFHTDVAKQVHTPCKKSMFLDTTFRKFGRGLCLKTKTLSTI